MNMAEAKLKLMELARKPNPERMEYHTMEYKICDHGRGDTSQTCKVYVNGFGSFEAPYWEHALQAMEDAILGKPKISEDIPTSSPL